DNSTSGSVSLIYTSNNAVLNVGNVTGSTVTLTSNTGSASQVVDQPSKLVGSSGSLNVTTQSFTVSANATVRDNLDDASAITITTPSITNNGLIARGDQGSGGAMVIQAPS